MCRHLASVGCSSDVWAWPLLSSFFARVLSRDDWLQLWDHLVCMAPPFLLYVLANFVDLHAPLLVRCTSADACSAILLRPCALQMQLLLSSSYAQWEGTPADALPKWKPFAPLPPGDVYPPGLPHPTVLVDHGAAQIEAIRTSEAEIARQRTLAAAVDEAAEEEERKLAEWSAREAALAEAEQTARRQLQRRRQQLEAQQAETALALKEQRLKSAGSRAERLRLAQAAREREHEGTMRSLKEQLDDAEHAAHVQLSARAEEFQLLAVEARAQEEVLAAQQRADENAARVALEVAVAGRAAELKTLEDGDAQAAAARLEAAALRRAAEAARREKQLANHWEQSRQASVEAELRAAELRRTMRAAELARQAELEVVRQEEAELSRASHDAESERQRLLAQQDAEEGERLLSEQRVWIARRQSERAAIIEQERRLAAEKLGAQTSELSEIERQQRRRQVERAVEEASQLHLAADLRHESQLTSTLSQLQAAASLGGGGGRGGGGRRGGRRRGGGEGARVSWWARWRANGGRAQQQRAAMVAADQISLQAREAYLAGQAPAPAAGGGAGAAGAAGAAATPASGGEALVRGGCSGKRFRLAAAPAKRPRRPPHGGSEECQGRLEAATRQGVWRGRRRRPRGLPPLTRSAAPRRLPLRRRRALPHP